MYAEPTIPKTSFTLCATSVSTNASEGVIFCLPVTARFLVSVMVFMATPRKDPLQEIVAARRGSGWCQRTRGVGASAAVAAATRGPI